MPKWLIEKPTLTLGLDLYHNAFWALNDERGQDFGGYLRIKRRDILDYAIDYQLDERQKDNLLFYVQEMDTAFLKYVKSKEPKAKKSGKSAGPSKEDGDD